MFSIMISGFNLNSLPKLFDFTLLEETYTAGYTISSSNQVGLVACTEEHFAFTDSMRTTFNNGYGPQQLCPPIGHSFTLKGKASGDHYKSFRVVVDRCNPAVDPTCLDDATFAAI